MLSEKIYSKKKNPKNRLKQLYEVQASTILRGDN